LTTALAMLTIAELAFTNKPVISMLGVLMVTANKNIIKHKIRSFFINIIKFVAFNYYLN
jgi:hypothetical protein